jgi:hypothetical protein
VTHMSQLALRIAVLSGAFASCGGGCGPSVPGEYEPPTSALLTIKIARSGVSADTVRMTQARVSVTPQRGGAASRGAYETVRLNTLNCAGSACGTEKTEAIDVDASKVIEVSVDGYETAKGPVLVHRTARGRVPLGKSTLVLDLDPACLLERSPPICGTGSTCKNGQCLSDAFGLDDLIIEADTRNGATTDTCAINGEPAVFVGTGDKAFESIANGSSLEVYAGNQGGHHLLLSFQTANLVGKGLSIVVSGVQPDSGLELPITSFSAPFVAKGPRCEANSFIYRIDGGNIDYTRFVGKPLDLTVSAREASGKRASQKVRINVGT